MNHDALFKLLLKTPVILRGFFQAFVPEAAPFIDFRVLEFVDKERTTLDGRKRTGDLLVKTRFRGKPAGFLIHLEHQAQPDSDLGRRMLEYFVLDWREYDLPVYPVAVLSYPSSSSNKIVPVMVDFPDGRVLEFTFKVVRIANMRAESHVNQPNPAALAFASRMQSDPSRRVALMREDLVTLVDLPLGPKEQELVFGFYYSYQPLGVTEALQLGEEVAKLNPVVRQKIMRLTNPFIELAQSRVREQAHQEGLKEGRQEGLVEARRREAELVLRLLARRLGPVPRSQQVAVRRLSISKIEALGEALLDFNSPADLVRWLRRPPPAE